jgi:hypothetical protein
MELQLLLHSLPLTIKINHQHNLYSVRDKIKLMLNLLIILPKMELLAQPKLSSILDMLNMLKLLKNLSLNPNHHLRLNLTNLMTFIMLNKDY